MYKCDGECNSFSNSGGELGCGCILISSHRAFQFAFYGGFLDLEDLCIMAP